MTHALAEPVCGCPCACCGHGGERVITGHVFRRGDMATRQGYVGTRRIDPGHCCWLGTCNRPESDHITAPEFRRRKAAT